MDNNLTQITYPGSTLSSSLTAGTNPAQSTFNPSGTRLLVVNFNSGSTGSVSIFDATSSYSLLATPTVGNQPAGIAVTPDGKHAYIPNKQDNTVSVLDLSSNSVVATVSVSNGPDCVAVSPDGSICYVGTSAGVAQISTATNTTTGAPIDSGHAINSLATDGTNLYCVDSTGGVVRVINISTALVSNTITVGTNPSAIAYDRSHGRLYVPNSSSNNLSVIDLHSMSVISTVSGFSASGAPSSVAVSGSGGKVYVGELNTAKIQLIDPGSLTIVSSYTCSHTAVSGTAAYGDSIVVGSLSNNAEVDAFVNNNTTALTYDPMDRCVKMVETGSTASTKQFIWCGADRCEVRDSAGTGVLNQYFTLGQVNASGSPASYFYSKDHLGSRREMTDSSGGIESQFSYSAYGEPTQIAGSGATPDFGYAGMYQHTRSGLNLTLFRAYQSGLGRWLSRDPLGEGSDSTLYSYSGNDPIDNFDPLGLKFMKTGSPGYDAQIDRAIQKIEAVPGLKKLVKKLRTSPVPIYFHQSCPGDNPLAASDTNLHRGTASIRWNPSVSAHINSFKSPPEELMLHEFGHIEDFLNYGLDYGLSSNPVRGDAEARPINYEEQYRKYYSLPGDRPPYGTDAYPYNGNTQIQPGTGSWSRGYQP